MIDPRPCISSLALAMAAALVVACNHGGPNPRTLHYVGKDLVASPPADHHAYAAYIQAQLAMASEPPDLRHAHAMIIEAIDHDAHDAHLWTVRGQIELLLGEPAQARHASERALSLRPDYPLARELAAKLRPVDDVRQAGIRGPAKP